jgi:hypothetical protein
VNISHKQARALGLSRKTPISPGLEKSCLRACAKASDEQASADVEQMMGIKVGHSTLHRMVARVGLSPSIAKQASEGMSIDGGKIYRFSMGIIICSKICIKWVEVSSGWQ